MRSALRSLKAERKADGEKTLLAKVKEMPEADRGWPN